MNLRRILIAIMLLAPVSAFAQFYLPGDEPSGRWMQIRSQNYQLIYPQALPDSVAVSYISALEKYNPYVGISAGMTPGQYHWGNMPVVLHAYTPLSNGSVAWAPRRIDLYTTPEAYSPLAIPWIDQLVIHEQRHVSQMQFGYRSYFKPINYIVGEMWNGAAAGIFADKSLMEGDAVVAETALTHSGRGRSAEFMNYYRVAFDNGDFRGWDRWRYGSFKYPVPNHYALGYMLISGMRYFYDRPDFTAEYYNGMLKNPFPFGKLGRMSKRLTGQKFKDSFRSIMEGYQKIWEEEDLENGPYQEREQVTSTPRLETNYSNPVYADGRLFILKSGKAQATTLITIDPETGKEERIRPFNPTCSSIVYDKVRNRLYWSETISDKRWSLGGESIIRYIDLSEPKRQHDLLSSGRYFTPVPSPDGKCLSAASYPVEGGSFLVVLSADDGSVLWQDPSPFQLTETVWLGGEIYALGVAEGGIGLWKHPGDGPGEWTPVLEPSFQQVDDLDTKGSLILFESDRSGLRQLYTLDPQSGELLQASNVKYGGTAFIEIGGYTYFTALSPMGKMLFRLKDSWSKPVNYNDLRPWIVADAMSRQEAVMAEGITASAPTEITAPKAYSRLSHMLKFHSWAPIYFDYDELSSFSGDFSYSVASPGATALFQNDLGNLYGTIGYSAHPDVESAEGGWRHEGHLKLTYSGLFPVFEGGLNINESDASQYRFQIVHSGDGGGYLTSSGTSLGMPLVSGYLSAWLPLSWNKGGILSGFTPRIAYGISNSRYNTGAIEMLLPDGYGSVSPVFTGLREGHNPLLQSMTVSMRGYYMMQRGAGQKYPRWGIGAEAGYGFRPGIASVFAPSAYGYLYGYLPGFTGVQGWKLTALGQYLFRGKEMLPESRVSCTPRGYEAAVGRYFAQQSNLHMRATADYVIPVYVGDLNLIPGTLYIRNFLLTPHADAALYGSTFLGSAGIDITAEMPSLLGILPFDCSLGVEVDYLWGSALPENLKPKLPVTASLIFDVDF